MVYQAGLSSSPSKLLGYEVGNTREDDVISSECTHEGREEDRWEDPMDVPGLRSVLLTPNE